MQEDLARELRTLGSFYKVLSVERGIFLEHEHIILSIGVESVYYGLEFFFFPLPPLLLYESLLLALRNTPHSAGRIQ